MLVPNNILNFPFQDNFRIDSVVCLVDAKHIGIHLDDVKPDGDVNEAEHQIAFADRIVLNKMDLVSEEELEEVQDRIRSMNSFATLIKVFSSTLPYNVLFCFLISFTTDTLLQSTRSRVPLEQILALNTFSLAKLEEMDPTFMQPEDEVKKNKPPLILPTPHMPT